MKFSRIYILLATTALFTGCTSHVKLSQENPTIPKAVDESSQRIDKGIESAQRALPTLSDAAHQPAHYQHVYVDSLSDASESLKTITLADAVANDVLASSDFKVRKMDLDSSKLKWVVLDRADSRPTDIEAVGGSGIDRENLSEVNFNLNETVIINTEKLDNLIEKANRVSGVFYIVGFADESGIEAKNYLLSQDRAVSVSTYLASRNIHPSRIHHSGAGVSRLYQGLDQNRRASVSFLIERTNK